MARCLILSLVLACLMAFFVLFPMDEVGSQASRLNSAAVNALAAGSASYDEMFVCPKNSISEMDSLVAAEPANANLLVERARCRRFFAANTSVDEYRRILPKLRTDNLSDLEKAIGSDPENARAYFLRAKLVAESLEGSDAETHKGKMLAIVGDLDRAIELQPNDADALYYRAIFRSELNNKAGAFEDLGRAIDLAPNKVLFLGKRAEMLLDSGEAADAIKDLTKLVELDSEDTLARLNRARAYRLAKENTKALADLNLVLRQAKYFEANVLEERAKVHRAMGNVRAAMADERRLRAIRR